MAESSTQRVDRLGLLTICCIALVFSPLLTADYVWDDAALILENPSLTGSGGLVRAWTDGLWASTPREQDPALYYRPWMLWSLWVDARTGPHPGFAHAHSLAWHLVCVLLARVVARRSGLSSAGAWAVAAGIGLHPVVVESTAWVSARNDPMALVGALGVLALSLGAHSKRTPAYIGAMALLAAGSKESAYLLPLAMVPVLWAAKRPWVRPAAATTVAVAAIIGARLLAGVGWPTGADLDHLVASAGPMLRHTLTAVVAPGLRVPGEHLAWPAASSTPWWLAGVGLLGAVAWKGGRSARAWLVFAALGTVPAWPAVAHVGQFGDRYLLWTVAGVVFAIGHTLQGVPHRARFVMAALGLAWWARSAGVSVPAWLDDSRLWTAAVEEHPNPHTAGSLAKVLELSGDLDGAAHWYAEATTGPRPLEHACWNVAALEVKRGQPAAAARVGERALQSGCAPDAELVCPTALGHAWSGAWSFAASRSGPVASDPTGLCNLVGLVLAARSGDWSALDRAAGADPTQRGRLADQLGRVLLAGGDVDTAQAVEAWVRGGAGPAGG